MTLQPGLVEAVSAVTSAAVLGAFGVIAHRVRSENKDAHDSNRRVLDDIDRRTEKMDAKLDAHGEWIAGHKAWHKGRGDNGN